jgi:transposase
MGHNTKLDFSDQDIYIGLDIHKKNWTVSIFTEDFEHKTFSQNPEPDILVNYLHRNFPGANYHSVYEAGYCGFWIHEALRAHGINNIVSNPADVPTKDKERKRKNNRIDSRKLARCLRSGDLEAIYVPKRKALEDRSLMRARRSAAKQQTRYKNQIKGFLSFFGIKIPEPFKEGRWSGAFIYWIETITMERATGKASLLFYLGELKHYRTKIAELNREIRKLATHEIYKERVKLLKTIPGIGPLTAMILLLELVDINRFKNLDKLASFIGLVPGEHSSGPEDNINNTDITPRSHHYLRAMLIEAAWVAVRKDPALILAFNELTKRMKKQDAIIRIAKKLLNRIRYVLKNHQPYAIAVLQ